MKSINIITVLAAFLFMAACKKENKESRMDLISSGNWKIISLIVEPGYDYDGDGDIDTEMFAVYEACEKDDFFVFKRDGILEINEGPSKCDPSYPQVSTVVWEFANNEKEVIIDDETYMIDEISASRLKLRSEYTGNKTVITMSK